MALEPAADTCILLPRGRLLDPTAGTGPGGVRRGIWWALWTGGRRRFPNNPFVLGIDDSFRNS